MQLLHIPPFHSAGTTTLNVTPSLDQARLIVTTAADLARMDFEQVCTALSFFFSTIIVRSSSVLVVGIASGLRRTGQSGEPAPASHKRVSRPHGIDQPSRGYSTSIHTPNLLMQGGHIACVCWITRNPTPYSNLTFCVHSLEPRFHIGPFSLSI